MTLFQAPFRNVLFAAILVLSTIALILPAPASAAPVVQVGASVKYSCTSLIVSRARVTAVIDADHIDLVLDSRDRNYRSCGRTSFSNVPYNADPTVAGTWRL